MNILFSLVLIVQSYGCNHSRIDYELKKTREVFNREYSVDIHNHFPDNLDISQIINAKFNRPDSFSYFGSSFITLKMQEIDLNEITNRKFVFKSNLNSDLLFVISPGRVKDCEKVDTIKSYDDAFPIADINIIDYNLGEIPDSVFIPKGNKYYPVDKYVIPDDMAIYIIDFACGNFWISNKYNEKRCDKIGQMKNGYSYGYAISEKYKYVTYWAVAW